MRLIRLMHFMMIVFLVGCGGGGGGGGSSSGQQQARSQTCGNVSGLTAMYWDFSNGIPRGDLPGTAFTIPFANATIYQHPTDFTLFFTHPSDWTPETLGNPAGVNLIRNDGRALWRQVSGSINFFVNVQEIVNSEVNLLLNNFGFTEPVQTICSFDDAQTNPFGQDIFAASRLIRVSDFTANIVVRVVVTPTAGNSLVTLYIRHTNGPTAEFDRLINDVFIPIDTQFFLGGPSAPECSDGFDNDGDNLADVGIDPDCDSASDDNEAG